MKNLLFLLFAIALLSSCVDTKYTEDEITIPKGVYEAVRTAQVPDTLYRVETLKYDYYFNTKKEAVAVYGVEEGSYSPIGLTALLVVSLFFFLFMLIAAVKD